VRRFARQTFTALLCCQVIGLASAAAESGLPVDRVQDLAADAARARAQGVALLIAVTREDCPYCRLLLRDFLGPMSNSGEYAEQVLIRELMIEPATRVVDFDGGQVSSAKVAHRYRTRITPTVLLLDPRGHLLHEPLVGINTPEMYGYYLDQAIQSARSKLAAGHSAGVTEEN
jgi:thioredoxin-related protein